ncbi:response regulator [Bradyrhizobium retamae]|uniref:LuxR family transcriptional regulator n=1 Tax=Bradyrhizobium retamae TaxID=1300035 RepID=A0A0R3MK40_9BRAD|nr:response regulator transcription factor [Bradyrhizobium retamae]KRR20491.1 LuxR family transcriptional regulator [Bradyrhizobium retamae]
MSSIRVMLADDHPVVLAGMKALLDGTGDITVVGEATTGPGALKVFREADPDIAVLDISLPEINGLKLAEIAAIDFPKIKVLALTVHEDRAYVQPMMRAGARGYLLKRSAAEELVRAIRAIASGGLYLDPTIAEMVVPPPPDQATGGPQLAELSQRETEVLQMISRGLSNKEISGRLDVSIKTVETHKARALEKLGLRTRAEIVRYGVAHRWLDDLQ